MGKVGTHCPWVRKTERKKGVSQQTQQEERRPGSDSPVNKKRRKEERMGDLKLGVEQGDIWRKKREGKQRRKRGTFRSEARLLGKKGGFANIVREGKHWLQRKPTDRSK